MSIAGIDKPARGATAAERSALLTSATYDEPVTLSIANAYGQTVEEEYECCAGTACQLNIVKCTNSTDIMLRICWIFIGVVLFFPALIFGALYCLGVAIFYPFLFIWEQFVTKAGDRGVRKTLKFHVEWIKVFILGPANLVSIGITGRW